MGLFDFFKTNSTHDTIGHSIKPERETIVPVEEISQGKHGDHWAALIGFTTFYNTPEMGKNVIISLLDNGEKSQINNDYFKQEISYPLIKLKAISSNKQFITGYPVIKSDTVIATKTKVIKEWKHVNGIEAQIEAQGKNTFGLLYFATDYLEKKDIYKSKLDLNIRLSGFAYSVGPAPESETMAKDFVGFLPHKKHGSASVIDFVAEIVGLKKVNEADYNIDGYIAKLRLIQMEDEKDFFVLETFISKENIELPSISVGERISGILWLQGQIAD